MVANRRRKLPAAPRRRTPDHPPYALMISAAIKSLAEEGGSTEAAISQFLRANYDDLPWGHDKLLPYYLNKLTAAGEFVEAAPGRYLIGDDADVSGTAIAESTPSQPAADALQPSIEPRDQEESHGGVGSAVTEAEPSPFVLALSCPENPVITPPPPPVPAAEGEGSNSVAPRRRGRPPKVKPLVDTEGGGSEVAIIKGQDGRKGPPTPDDRSGDRSSAAPTPKRRGRPPKRKNTC